MLEKKISDLLVYVADPFNENNLTNQDYINIRKQLKQDFERGHSLLDELRLDCISGCGHISNFEEYKINNPYELLKFMMEKRPVRLVQQLQKTYRIYHKSGNNNKRVPFSKLTEEELKMIDISQYTHKWRQEVEKRPHHTYSSFNILKKRKLVKAKLYIQRNKNLGNLPHAVFQRQKRRKRIIEKLIKRIIDEKDKIGDSKNFNNSNCYVEDFFGLKICCTNWNPQNINNLLYNSKSKKWVVDNFIDHRKDTDKNINHLKYYLHKKGETRIPLELQFTTINDFLLDEFFSAENHVRYTSKRRTEMKEYKKRKEYGVMEERLQKLLSFL
ncbi:hypothetical protein H8D83_01835 [Candidatus Woesearchaeota archaeon]|nr:hypothetical protein [Candidatus Woesearchaeota archaeon]MBL7050694.1 hypothetical protein [Candidatus Woesearchaeota archaeon]